MLIPPAFAQAAGAPAGAVSDGGALASIVGFAPLILVFVVFYFLILRPQQTRAKAQAAKIGAVKKGDSVVTAGGVLGKVTKVEEQYVELEIAANVRVRVVKSTLAEVSGTGTVKPAND